MKKKIAFTTLSFKGGGAEKIFFRLIEKLCHNYEIVLITFHNEGRYFETISSLPVTNYSLSGTKDNSLNYILRLRKILKKEKPEKIVSFLYFPTIITYLSSLGLNIDQIPSERSNHRKYLNNSIKHKIYRYLLKRCYTKAKSIAVLSEEMKQNMMTDFKLAGPKLHIIYNGLDFNSLDKLAGAKDPEVAQKPGLPTLVSVGRLNVQKNYPLLLNAFKLFNQKHPDSELIIFGNGELEEELKEITRKLKIADRVCFKGYSNNPFPYLASATCYVLSSSWEGFPNALVEAMYVNGYVISTDCPTGPSEIITNMEDGILCPVNDTNALAAAMEKMCFDKEFREKVYRNSRIKINRFDEKLMIENYKKIIEDYAK